MNVFQEKTLDENRRETVKEGCGLLHGGGSLFVMKRGEDLTKII